MGFQAAENNENSSSGEQTATMGIETKGNNEHKGTEFH
jgi:hypothetical protein